ncbi:hypothetical protein PybrP1_000078 [[Pythium] brassicae (nom. inval.)]|nr:hypothetical protein PybrP1_000078 [[Pythium] brassicae (nom. inval.)]
MPAQTTRVRMTKKQQLLVCRKSDACLGMTNRQLAEWAAPKFCLPKTPVKSTIFATLRSCSRLDELAADCVERKEFRAPGFLQQKAVVAEFVVRAEWEGFG